MKKIILISFLFIYSFKAFSQGSENIDLIYNWDDNNLVSTPDENTFNEVWGYSANGREYAFIGSTWGTHVFDVTDISNVVYVDSIPGRQQGPFVIHRDYHNYGSYLYAVCDEGASSLQIMDLSYLPDSIPVVYDEDSLFVTAHNIFIDEEKAKLYVCGPSGFYSMLVYSLANPLSPSLLYEFSETPEVHDVYVRNDVAFVNAGDGYGLNVFYFLNSSNPSLLSTINNYEDYGYNHSGWLNEDGSIYVFADETAGKRIKLCQYNENYTEGEIISLFGSGQDPKSMPHNIIFKDELIYVSYYEDGLYIFEMNDIENPTMVGYYDTYDSTTYNYYGAWGVYPFLPSGNVLVSDRDKGLMVFNVEAAIDKAILLGLKDLEIVFEDLISFPNPFTNNINISFELDNPKNISFSLIDEMGRKIQSLAEQKLSIGKQSIQFENLEIGKGIYFLEIESGGEKISRKLIKK